MSRLISKSYKIPISIFEGKGKFKENTTGDEYELMSIYLPFNANGKYISVRSKDEDLGGDVCEWREYTDGIILEFQIESIHYQ